ncbi:MAG TPA: hypothetical protein VFH88_15470, partial [Candidatus Krumholzibacteria bacterium]|nr:hypothetical protein [Candidatus Krumholzibacteria bacterium]
SVALCDAPDGRGGAWSPNGVILLAPQSQGPIERVSANGGDATPVTTVDRAHGERGHRYPQFLPDGEHFLYVAVGAVDKVTTYRTSINGGEPEAVCEAGSKAVWASPGYLLFLDTGVNSPHRRLLAQRVDANLHAIGDRQLIVDPVNATNFGYPNVAVDDQGTLVVEHWSMPHERLEWRSFNGTTLSTAVDDISYEAAVLSPDGTRLAYGGTDPPDVFILDLDTKVSTRLTFENRDVTNLTWSHDQKRLAFSRLSQANGWQMYTKATDGTGPDSLVFRGPAMFNFATDWSRDGHWIVAQCADSSGARDLWKVDMTNGGKPTIYQATPGDEQAGNLSPDGKWLVYTVIDGGERALYVQSFPTPGAKYQVTIKNPAGAFWSKGGDILYVGTMDGGIYSIQVSTVGGFRQGATQRLSRLVPTDSFLGSTPDEKKMLIGVTKDLSSVSRLEIVLNWQRLLQSK